MDTDMMDAAYDIDIDVGTGTAVSAQHPQPVLEQNNMMTDKTGIPEAYLEDAFTVRKPVPESLNLQGVSDFDPNDPLYYAMEYCGSEPRVKQLRWVNDSSVNLEFYSTEDATAALGILTHVEAGDAAAMDSQTARRAKPYAKKPESTLMIREAHDGDQKPRGAANRSNYYKHNPDIAGNRQREPHRRQPPRRDVLNYGNEDSAPVDGPRRRSRSGDEPMHDDSAFDRRRNQRNGRDNRDVRDHRGRGGRESDAARHRADVDSYRPGENSPQESRFGRLRGRSASPASDEEGDGRYGFAKDSTHTGRRRYRSRSRSRNTRHKREANSERWTHDRANHDRTGSGHGRWQKGQSVLDSLPQMGNHRRSFAVDASAPGSLLARMTKDGAPVAAQRKRSLADRITRNAADEDMSYGRLNNDDRQPWDSDDSELAPKRKLVDRITRDTRLRGEEGINIRGSSSNGVGGINIRGVASGA